MLWVYPYKAGSRSVVGLRQNPNIKGIKLKGSKFKGGPDKTVINWGNSSIDDPQVNACRIINLPRRVERASNKLKFFELTTGHLQIPKFTTDKQRASGWIGNGTTVFCRTVLQGHSGQGIIIADRENPLVDAPLYVAYIKKSEEYRVHVMAGNVFDIQRKARRLEVPDEDVNWQIRNHNNGFIYARDRVDIDEIPSFNRLRDSAVLAIALAGLDFGAVDVIYNTRNSRYTVLEINTAPGLEGTTLAKYQEAFERYYI